MDHNKQILIQSDFDDTITIGNVSLKIRESFASPGWREIERQFYAGKYTAEQSASLQFALVRASEQEIDEFISSHVIIRDGFVEFVEYCESLGLRFVVVSSGLDSYIYPTMRRLGLRNIEVHSATATYTGGSVQLSYNDLQGNVISKGFKDWFARQYKQSGYQTFYIGDGFSDLEPSRHADHVIARSRLASNCETKGIKYYSFSDFHDVKQIVQQICEEIGT